MGLNGLMSTMPYGEGSYESDSSWHSPENPHPVEPRKKRTSEDEDEDYVLESQAEVIVALMESE